MNVALPSGTLQGKDEEAKPLYVRSLAIYEKVYGPDHPDVATCLNNLAMLVEQQVVGFSKFRAICAESTFVGESIVHVEGNLGAFTACLEERRRCVRRTPM